MAGIPEEDYPDNLTGGGSDSSNDKLGINFEDPLTGGPEEGFAQACIFNAPPHSQLMMPSGGDLAEPVHTEATLASFMALAASIPPQLLEEARESHTFTGTIPTILFSPAPGPSCGTSPTQASSPPPPVVDCPSPASLLLSPRKVAKRWSSKHPVHSLIPQLSVERAASFLHSLAIPAAPTAPSTATAIAYVGHTSESLTISCSALSNLLWSFGMDIIKLPPAVFQQLLLLSSCTVPNFQTTDLQPRLPHMFLLLWSYACLPYQSTGFLPTHHYSSLQPAFIPENPTVLSCNASTPAQPGLTPTSLPPVVITTPASDSGMDAPAIFHVTSAASLLATAAPAETPAGHHASTPYVLHYSLLAHQDHSIAPLAGLSYHALF
ncbi:hypothetical protein C0989_010856 [Termitomyces sp. Mn162]|nr:hypothetical protein C0989_010856 [Termitomyces sp. Mn162]KAH0579703.1 hypothetical protein H2248_002546 [Termitomyces sp. 'cryptogamus']